MSNIIENAPVQHIIFNLSLNELFTQVLCVAEYTNGNLAHPSRVIPISQIDEVSEEIFTDFSAFPLLERELVGDNMDQHLETIKLMQEHYLDPHNGIIHHVDMHIGDISKVLREKHGHQNLTYEEVELPHLVEFIEKEFHVEMMHEQRLVQNVYNKNFFASVFLEDYLEDRKERIGF